MQVSSNRRDFLKRSAAFGAFSFLPASLVMGTRSRAATVSPNEKVRLAVIGIGNQGERDLENMVQSGHCDVVALCDVDLNGKHTQMVQKLHPKAKRYTDFRKMFDQMADGIDAVLIATPDHAHFCMAMLAMSLGKHVYVEKPLAHSFGECERLMAMAEKSGVVTQMGNQGHSGANYFQFKAWAEAGIVKDITRIDAWMNGARRWHGWGASVKKYPSEPLPDGMNWPVWCGSAPEHPFSRQLHPQEWRSWFDYGGGAFADWGPHIIDTAHRFLKLGLPTSIRAVKLDGANPLVFPQASTISMKFPERQGMPACELNWYDGQGNRPKVAKELGDVKMGAPGKILYGKELTFKGGHHADVLQVLPREKFLEMRGSLPRVSGKTSNHYANFLLACKGLEEARSPFSVAAPMSQVVSLGVLAQRVGGEFKFDPVTKKITNRAEAQRFLDPAPRKGWEEFYRL